MKESYPGTDVLKLMADAKNYNNSLVKLCLKNMNEHNNEMVDFGAGIGTYSALFKAAGYDVKCVEIDKYLSDVLKKKNYRVINNMNSNC